MTVEECFAADYRLCQGLCHSTTEFKEGVRAALIDKDKKPKWMHKSVRDVTKAEIDALFNYPASCNLDITKY